MWLTNSESLPGVKQLPLLELSDNHSMTVCFSKTPSIQKMPQMMPPSAFLEVYTAQNVAEPQNKEQVCLIQREKREIDIP